VGRIHLSIGVFVPQRRGRYPTTATASAIIHVGQLHLIRAGCGRRALTGSIVLDESRIYS
jgi:hypothetical protein